jgi:hypothetical protein
LVRPNDRCPEIAFSDQQKAENEDTEIIMEKRRIILKFCLGTFAD